MQDALNLLPEPAALYEYPSLVFVSWNAAGQALGEGKPDRDGVAWLDLPAEQVVQEVVRAPDHHYVVKVRAGAVHMSVLDPLPTHARPSLLLVTVHYGRPSEGYLQHLRMRTALFINEAADTAELQLNLALNQVAATLASMREVAKMYNDTAGRVMESTALEELRN